LLQSNPEGLVGVLTKQWQHSNSAKATCGSEIVNFVALQARRLLKYYSANVLDISTKKF
jgi:hypothetical protein